MLAFGLHGDVQVVGTGFVNGTKHLPISLLGPRTRLRELGGQSSLALALPLRPWPWENGLTVCILGLGSFALESPTKASDTIWN